MTASTPPSHSWRFLRIGGSDQVSLASGADLAALDQLDQKLWAALSCPTRGLEIDSATLDLIDSDKDGRIRAPDVVSAVKWACNVLKHPDELLKGSSSLPLAALDEAKPEGKALLDAARQILINLGKEDAAAISIEDTHDRTRIFGQTNFNGDGVVTPEAAQDAATRSVLEDVISCLGGEPDRSGKAGVNQAKADQFFAALAAFSNWARQGETSPARQPLGESTPAAVAAYRAVKVKVDDYFARCRLASFDSRALAALNRDERDYAALGAKDLSIQAPEVGGFPLARIEADRPLPLLQGVNPAWSGLLAAFRFQVVQPLLDAQASLTETQWAEIAARLKPYEEWQAAKAGVEVEKLGLARVRGILASQAQATINGLIAKDKALEPETNSLAAVDRLLRYNRDLYRLLNNFVSFHDFYSRRNKAVFQAGTLYLDQRSCDLCLLVEDMGKHAAMAGLAGMCLAYCDCVRKSSGQRMQIVAAFTDGDSDNLMVGRNGVFYDRKGRDWDATIVKILDNPISMRQAFWYPYQKLVRMVEEQIAKRAGAAEAAATTRLQSVATATVQADKIKPPQGPAKVDVGAVAALGVAFGAIGTAMSALATGLLKLPVWQVPLVFVSLVFLVSGPSMLIAWLKLRKRNLGPLLDANGWAVNARARINVAFGRSLTSVAKLPPGSQRQLADPFADKANPWPRLIVLAAFLWATYTLLDRNGYVHDWTHGWLGNPPPSIVEK